MTEKQQAYYQQIQESLEQLELACSLLKSKNQALVEENQLLKGELIQAKHQQKGSGAISFDENHRTALKHQLSAHIKRLDEILKAT